MAAGALLVVVAILALLMQICIRKLARRMREHHPETFKAMGLEDFARGGLPRDEDPGPTFGLVRFCWRREYLALHDRELTRLGGYLRVLILVWPCLFVAFGFTLVTHPTGKASQPRNEQSRSSAESAPGTARERALNLHRAGKIDEAIQAYDALLRTGGPDAEILYWRAMAFGKANQPEMALQDARRVIEIEPANLDASRLADRILGKQQRWDEVIKVWDRFIAIAPPNEDAYFERSGAHFRKGDIAAASSDAAKSCALGKPQACVMAERLKGR